MHELISVIVPVYNVAPYLRECVDSLLAQTYAALEILLVDDGSTDGSGALCDAYAERDSRINVIHQKNGGVSSARNAGLAASTGEYIGFVDADDWIEPDMYEKMIGAIGDADMICCGFWDYPMGTMEVAVPKGTKAAAPCDAAEAAILIYERDGYFTSSCNKLYRRQALERDNRLVFMDTSLHCGEDEVWLAQVITGCQKIAFFPIPLYFWRPRGGSATRNAAITERQLTVLRSKQIVLSILPQSEKVQTLVRAGIYNDCYLLKVKAYCLRDNDRFREISDFLAPFRRDWLRSSDSLPLRKIKVLLMELEMKLRLPGKIVSVTDSWRRYGIKR